MPDNESKALLATGSKQQRHDFDFCGSYRPLADVGLACLKVGDVIEFNYFLWQHAAVIEAIIDRSAQAKGCLQVCVIHYGRHHLMQRMRIMREQLTLRSDDPNMRVLEYAEILCYPPLSVVSRARSRLNEQSHSVYNDSHDFASWCKIRCRQQRRSCSVPLQLGAESQHFLHQLRPGSHVQLPVQHEAACGTSSSSSSSLHAIVVNVQELGASAEDDAPAAERLLLLTCQVLAVCHDKLQLQSLQIRSVQLAASRQLIRYGATAAAAAAADGAAAMQLDVKAAGEAAEKLLEVTFRRRVQPLVRLLLLFDSRFRGNLRALADLSYRLPDAALAAAAAAAACKRRVCAAEIAAGDIISLDGTVSLVLSSDKSEDKKQRLQLMQYRHWAAAQSKAAAAAEAAAAAASASGSGSGLQTIMRRFLISSHDPQLLLCVHNEDREDCSVLGAGLLRTPVHSVQRVHCVQQLQRGVAISWRRPIRLHQHAIVLQLIRAGDSDTVEMQVAHYALRWRPLPHMQLVSRKLRLNVRKTRIFVVHYSVPAERQFDPQTAAARASSRIGERQYSLQWNSSREFARWCSVNHPTNRELCRVPVTSGRQLQQLVTDGHGHVSFRRMWGLYYHEAVLRECELLQECSAADVVQYRSYESGSPFRIVQTVTVEMDGKSQSGSTTRFVYGQRQALTRIAAKVEKLVDHTLICESSRGAVTDRALCEWLQLSDTDDLSDLHQLLLRQTQHGASSRERVRIGDLREGDHVLLRIAGKQRHALVLRLNSAKSSIVCVTYDRDPQRLQAGPRQYRGFLLLPSDSWIRLYSVLHNLPLKWDLVDARFNFSSSHAHYDILHYNSEHYCNFLVTGRSRSVQVSHFLSGTANWGLAVGRALHKLFLVFGDMANLLGRFQHFIAGGAALGLLLLLTGAEVGLVLHRSEKFGMPLQVLRRKLANILLLAISCIVSSLALFLIGHFYGDSLGIGAMLAAALALAVGCTVIGQALTRLPMLWQRLWP